jgi:hypothetical protein
MAVIVKDYLLWDVMPCSQYKFDNIWKNMILNVKFLPDYTVKHLSKVLENNCCHHRLNYESKF